ncbi:SDR family oxidoreductase [Neobacillus sp. MM2021_6]|uniref:SDR family oxidoreductase n=1 Tax=Bacillaceae TaxID=186817 RepID=UPI00140C76D3|nr:MULTISPECIES: SDR family NAD(P)-dependent oxidoreductase [Bacillaceae]MBO0960057.1 SDR family oxidoreductase [Neobacillus sp. MM2021_6]NHC21272.1 SDR family oxidoreductase [Bacillus sp. MM2020_4]
MGKLSGKYAIVTGGGKGIGESIVKRFLEDGIEGVAVLEYDVGLVERMISNLGEISNKVLPIRCDVSNEAHVSTAVSQVVERFGTVDILVNNAGITRDSMFHKMADEAWDAVINVNLKGAYHLCKYVIPIMRNQSYGRIVNISSVSAFGNAGQANYAASKAGLIGFSKTLAKEGGPKNITVNCVAPGYIETDMYHHVPEEIIAEHMKLIPLRRLGQPNEVASAVSFLSSDDASFISGHCLILSGGATT